MTIITAVRVNLQRPDTHGIIAYAELTLNGDWCVANIRVKRCADGRLYVFMPSRLSANGEHRDVAHPLTRECRQRIEAAIYAEIDRQRREQPAAPAARNAYP